MGKIITFVGPGYSGRTTVVLNMAYVLSQEGYKTLVVDADQTMGKLSAHIKFERKVIGLAEAVTSMDESIFNHCYIKDKKRKLEYLTLPDTAKCNDLFELTNRQAAGFYSKIQKQYDYVLVDTRSILYEALSGYSLISAEKIVMVLPQEKRGYIWLNATESVLKSLNLDNLVYAAVNLNETPEISGAQLLGGDKRERVIALPYIFNMRDYMMSGDIFLQNPTGKKAQDYEDGIRGVIQSIEERGSNV